jgi:hypothetical protein
MRHWAARAATLALACALSLGLAPAALRAQARPPEAPQLLPEKQEGFYDIDELERLFQIARESGFSEEDIRQITIQDEEGNTVNAWQYLQEVKRRRALRDQADQEKLSKIYITVQDILSDLSRREREDLRKLRDQSAFSQ